MQIHFAQFSIFYFFNDFLSRSWVLHETILIQTYTENIAFSQSVKKLENWRTLIVYLKKTIFNLFFHNLNNRAQSAENIEFSNKNHTQYSKPPQRKRKHKTRIFKKSFRVIILQSFCAVPGAWSRKHRAGSIKHRAHRKTRRKNFYYSTLQKKISFIFFFVSKKSVIFRLKIN